MLMLIARLPDPDTLQTRRAVGWALLHMIGQALTVSSLPSFVEIGDRITSLPPDGDEDSTTENATAVDDVRGLIDAAVNGLQSEFGEVSAVSREAYFLRLLNGVELGLNFVATGTDDDFATLCGFMNDQFEMMRSLADDDEYEQAVVSSIVGRLDGNTDPDHNVIARDALVESRRPRASELCDRG